MARHTRSSTVHANSGGGEIIITRTVKTRRPHTKSRNGCTECKNRHIRCDQRQPSCANCEAAERTCFFPPSKVGTRKPKKGQQYRANQKQRPEAAALSPSSEMSSSANNLDRVEHTYVSPLGLHQQNNQSELDQVPEQQTIAGLDIGAHQLPFTALPMQQSDLCTPPGDCLPGFPSVPDTVAKVVFTPQHMILLRCTDTVPNFTGTGRSVVDIAIRCAVDSTYLLDEVLAFTAFHMAHLYPGSAAHLRQLATELQTRALASFTRVTERVPKDDKATAVPRFLFSAILGRHVLADTLAHFRSDFHAFIDRFVECFNLNRGIRAVCPPARDYLYDSEIQPILKVVIEAQNKITSPGNECNPLSRLMDESDLNDASAKACRQAIGVLQHSFDICSGLNEEDYPQAVSVFSVRIEAGFVDVLRKHRPEALVILAYYGVLLHRCRSSWDFGDAGASMIYAIAGHVGRYWQEALTWPLCVLETERSSDPADLASRCDLFTTSLGTPT